MKARIITIILILFSLLCKKETPSKDSHSIESTETIRVSNTWCVGPKKGLNVREKPDLKSKSLETLPYQTEVSVLSYSSQEEKVAGRTYPWAEIEYKGSVAWVYSGYLKVDCEDYETPDPPPDWISESAIIGTWKSEKKSEFYIEISGDNTFRANLFGGCDGDGCASNTRSGKWDLKDNMIYFYNEPERKASIYWIKDGLLETDRDHNGFKENYDNDLVSGFKKW